MTISLIILILLAVSATLLSALFSGAETGLYRLSRLRLRLGIEKEQFSSVLLGKLMQDGKGFLLSMLFGNNLAHYIVTGTVTVLLLNILHTEHTAELFATLIAAPILFVFAELIPKNAFFYSSDYLMSRCAFVLFVFHKAFNYCMAVPVLKFISRFFVLPAVSPVLTETMITAARKRYISAILKDTHEEAFLSPTQTDIMNRLAIISGIRLGSVMKPFSRVWKISRNTDKADLLDVLKKCPFTRLCVYEKSVGNVTGYINIYKALTSKERFRDLAGLLRPIRKLAADMSVSDALTIMQSEKLKIVLVTKCGYAGREKPVGIATMKDLVEELLGELAEW